MSDDSLLLLTKIRPPRLRSGTVARARLLERVNLPTPPKLILVSAPPGFGKTTLLSGLVRQQALEADSCAAWYSLDETDNSLPRFLLYLVQALEDALGDQLDFRALHKLVRSLTEEEYQPALISLINLIDESEKHCTLVLDDYHLINSLAVHSAVSFLLQNLPAQLTLAIGSRSDPPLQVSRLRARGQLLEFRAADLRFTPEECNRFLVEQTKQALSASDLSAAEEFTEGWAAGLQLLAIGLRQHIQTEMQANDQSHAPEQAILINYINRLLNRRGTIGDYLAEEVFAHQPLEIQRFLLETSILEGLGPDICAAITLREDAADILKFLERANLFVIPVEGQGYWYRYHHLFQQFLRERLQQTYPDLEVELHRRLLSWYCERGHYDAALRYGAGLKNLKLVADVAEKAVLNSLDSIDTVLLRDWPGLLPAEEVLNRPPLTVLLGIEMVWRYNHEQAIKYFDLAEVQLRQAPQIIKNTHLQAIILVGRSLIACNQAKVTETLEMTDRALAILPEGSVQWRSLAVICRAVASGLAGNLPEAIRLLKETIAQPFPMGGPVVIAYRNLAVLHELQGADREALAVYQQAVEWIEQSNAGLLPDVVALYGGYASLIYQQNNLELATRYATAGLELSKRYPLGSGGALCRIILADVWQAQGVPDKASEMMQELLHDAKQSGNEALLEAVHGVEAALNIRQGRLEEARFWAEAQLARASEPNYRKEQFYLIAAKVVLALGNAKECLDYLDQIELAEMTTHRHKRMLYYRIVQAQALAMLGQHKEAQQTILAALDQAAPEGNLRCFLDEGPAVERVLRLAQSACPHTEFIHQLLLLLAQPAASEALPEALSNRELEVLKLLPSGASNQELAKALSISISTVKVHINRILGKLEAKNRTEAVAHARERGIIS